MDCCEVLRDDMPRHLNLLASCRQWVWGASVWSRQPEGREFWDFMGGFATREVVSKQGYSLGGFMRQSISFFSTSTRVQTKLERNVRGCDEE
ncbi:unnamed protein product [Taenia asiatica]|uniref:Uncharacterized protein n=1 Tax=Taenia asiatica TaxID=60517 RepID=A0A0R3WGD3_TAEAS|nr:unnamed protein product [Taenia asiatica]